jgi:TonB-dependent receptor
MDPNMTGVMVNGLRAASASSANANRRFEFDQTSLQDVESIEIYKTPNAAMDADSGGGAVNIVSKSAFKLKGHRISYSLLANIISSDVKWGKSVFPEDDPGRYTSKIRPGATFSYSESFLNNRLGVVITGNYNEYYVNSHSHNNNYNLSAATAALASFPIDGPNGLYSRGFTYGINPITTQRTSVSVNLDYRLTESTTLWLRTQANTSQLRGGGRTLDVGVNAPTSPAASSNGVAAGWTAYSLTALGTVTRTAADAATSTSGTFAHVAGEFLDKVGADTKFSLGSTTKSGPWKIDTAVAASLSTNHYRNIGRMPAPQVDLYLRGVDFRIDSPSGSNYPTITQLSGPSIYDLSNYVSKVATGATSTVPGTNAGVNDANGNRIVFPDTSTGTGATAITYPAVTIDNVQNAPFQLRNGRRAGATDKFYNAKFDVRHDFATPWPTYTQFGGAFRRQDRSMNREGQARWLFVGPDGIPGTADDYTSLNLAQFKSTNISDTFGPYPQIPYYDLSAINRYFTTNRNLFKEDVAFRIETEGANAKTIREDVLGAYAMQNIRINRLNVLLGLRWERTDSEGQGPAVDNEGARDAAIADMLAYVRSQGYATINAAPATVRSAFRADAGRLARIRYAKRVTSTRSFDDFFPNVQTRYSLTKDLLLRASYNRSIARQDFVDVMPGYSVAAPANNTNGQSTVTISNTKLQPIYFNNYDLSLEYYLPQGGLLSASVYRKDVKNYTFNSTETIQPGVDYGYDLSGYIGDNLVRKVNGGDAHHQGIELNYSQRLGVFAPWLQPYSFYTGYTYQKAEGSATFGGTAAQPTTLPLRGVVPRMFNASLRYRGKKLAVSLTYNWKGHYPSSITTNTVTPSAVLIRSWDDRGTLDTTLSYDLFRQHSLFIDVRNVTNEPLREYVVNKSFTRAYAINGATIYVGIKGNF